MGLQLFFKRLALGALVTATGLFVSGCFTTAYVSGVVVAQDPEIKNNVLEAQSGDLIAGQNYEPAITVEVEAGVSMRFGLGTNNGFEAGDQFYLATTRDGLRFFCRVMTEPRPFHALHPTRSRPCLLDTDGDRQFDSAWRMMELDGNLRIDGGQIFDMGDVIDTPIPYKPVPVPEGAIAEHDLWARRGPLGGWYLTSAIRNLNDGLTSFEARTNLPPAEDLPTTISVMGTTLQILEYEGDTMRYRIVSQPPGGTPSRIIRYEVYY